MNFKTADLCNRFAAELVYGCIRDAFAIAQLPLGVKALGTCPLRTDKRGAHSMKPES